MNKDFENRIIHGDCITVMRHLTDESIDLVVTDPPYIVGYKDRDGRTLCNDKDIRWLKPSFAQVSRVLKKGAYCVSFYGWHLVERFMWAWKDAGLMPVGHIVWTKKYASNRALIKHHHEQAFVLAKGTPEPPKEAIKDVLPWKYTGNGLHPTQKPVGSIRPLILAFSRPGDIVLDPFAGSGSTAVAAWELGRRYIGIEKVKKYSEVATQRLFNLKEVEPGSPAHNS